MYIRWRMYPEGPNDESMAAVGTNHRVSAIKEFGLECCLTQPPDSIRLIVQGMGPSAGIMAANANTKHQSVPNSSPRWWSHVRSHALQKVLSGGFLIRKESPLEDPP